MAIKKAIFPVAGLGTRFLPLSKALPKELFPLVDKPTIHYVVEEAYASGIKEIIFVNSPEKKEEIEGYFKKYLKNKPSLDKILKKRGKTGILKELAKIEKIGKEISFSQVFQKNPLGDGHAVLQAKKLVGKEACLVLFADDIADSKIPAAKQLIKVFEKYKKPVIALSRLPKERLSSYGVVKVKKVAPRTYKIIGFVEKPGPGEAPSNLAVCGKYVINSDVFSFLEKTPSKAKGEIRLAGAFTEMIKRGMEIYGYEYEGKWLECGDKQTYLKSSLYFSLKDPRFKKELKKFLKEERL